MEFLFLCHHGNPIKEAKLVMHAEVLREQRGPILPILPIFNHSIMNE